MKLIKPDKPKEVGELTEAIVASVVLAKGMCPSVPIGDNLPYDMIIDYGGLLKCQIKTGWMNNGCVEFNTARSRLNTKGSYKRQYTANDVDLFIVYCYETDKVYVTPNMGRRRGMLLRVDKPKSNTPNILYAEYFEISEFIKAFEEKGKVELPKLGEAFKGWLRAKI